MSGETELVARLRKAGVTKSGTAQTVGGVSLAAMMAWAIATFPSKGDLKVLETQFIGCTNQLGQADAMVKAQLDRVLGLITITEARLEKQSETLNAINVRVQVLDAIRTNQQLEERRRYE